MKLPEYEGVVSNAPLPTTGKAMGLLLNKLLE
jgi:hypothetical protein